MLAEESVMSELKALRIALDLTHVPSRIRYARAAALPDATELLLRIAAGDAAAEREAVELIDRPATEIREAAGFFIEQILFAPVSDSYRVLGVPPDAPSAKIRRHMALLVRWLHPDRNGQCERHVFARRITSAWDDVKTAERRVAYDRRRAAAESLARNSRKRPPPWRSRAEGRQHWGLFHAAAIRAGDGVMPTCTREPIGLIGFVLNLLSSKRHP